MKILFSNPPWWEGGTSEAGSLRIGVRAGSRWPFTRQANHIPDRFKVGGYLPFPFFLGYAASYTKKCIPDALVWMRDSIGRGESYGVYLDYVAWLKPDWIIIETATPSWPHDERLIKLIAARAPMARIILAGPIDCAKAPAILSENKNVHAIVQGEYDKQITAVINGLAGYGLIPHNLLTLEEMNAAPAPFFDEVSALNYWDGCPLGQKAPQLQIWSSRGCPFKCIFCVWPATMTGHDPDGTRPRAVRCYSPEYMEAFIRARLAEAESAGYPYESIYFDDDTFNLTDRHVLAMCTVMKKIRLPWSAMCRADTIKMETWQAMKESGCFGVKLGFESGSQEVIDRIINKRLDLAKAMETARWLRSALGMTVHGTFTVGLPGETNEQKAMTLKFIRDGYATGGLDSHQLSGTAEIEGTPLHTLTHEAGNHLAKYPGAHADGAYLVSADGQKKIEGM
jgi:radical SAM superfamily enzyme YgiQ (UPF0313 family)